MFIYLLNTSFHNILYMIFRFIEKKIVNNRTNFSMLTEMIVYKTKNI
jgi:hypothetical protein